jgi:hypothetical protein
MRSAPYVGLPKLIAVRNLKYCHGPSCKATRLIKAHIVPRAFTRMSQSQNKKHNLELSLARVKLTQLGIFDKHILCDRCDGMLGKHDDYLYDIIRVFALPTGLSEYDEFSDPKVNCEAFCKGILAILWRASITSHPACSGVSLGHYEAIVRDIIFGLRPLADMHALEIAIQYYRSDHFGPKVNLFYTLPVQNKFEGPSGFSMGLNGVRIAVKIDDRLFPSSYGPYVINRTGVFRGLVVELERTPEFSRMVDIAVADMLRRGVSPPGTDA